MEKLYRFPVHFYAHGFWFWVLQSTGNFCITQNAFISSIAKFAPSVIWIQ